MQNLIVSSTIFDRSLKSKEKSQKKRNKRDICKWKFVVIIENFTILQEKIHWIEIEMTPINAELNGEFNDIGLKILIEAIISEENKQKDICKRKFVLITQNFIILREKIHSIFTEITKRITEFNGELKEIC